jgi:2-keto-3-deoxy-L-rhamnonate aldolase RhmA
MKGKLKMERVNKLRQVLAEGRVAVGTCADSYSPAIIETIGYSGLDWVRVDSEYSWRRDESMENMMRAAALAGITAMVRVEKGDPYLISKALQAGAQAIVVSDIVSYEEALAVVKAAKYPPNGHRGYSSFCFSANWGAAGGREWVEWNDREIMVGVMIENEAVVSEVEKVMAIEGLDYCLFGPADYSMSLGLRSGQKNHPKVQDAIKRTADAAARYNKAVAIGIGEPWQEEAKKYIDMGIRIIEVGHELGVLRAAFKKAGDSIRAL